MAKIGFARSGRDNELVVGDAALADQHGAARHVDAGNCAQDHVRVWLSSQNAAYRCGNVGRRQGCGRHLIQERLEQVVVAPVDHGHISVDLSQSHSRRKPAETGADNHDVQPSSRYRSEAEFSRCNSVDEPIHFVTSSSKC